MGHRRSLQEEIFHCGNAVVMICSISKKGTKRMIKLKMRIEIFSCGIAGEILEMDNRFRAQAISAPREFESEEGFKVASVFYPDMLENGIYLRGKERFDNRIMVRRFNSRQDKDEYLRKMLNALRAWSISWEGFQEEENPSDESQSNIWVF